MSRLFDAKKPSGDRQRNDPSEVRRRAAEFDQVFEGELSDVQGLSDAFKQGASVNPIRYERFREPGTRWVIDHALVGDSYMYQLHPIRPIQYPWSDVITALIGAMDSVFPKSVDVHYAPPNDQIGANFYTIRVDKVAGLPGWEDAARKRALKALAAIDVWS